MKTLIAAGALIAALAVPTIAQPPQRPDPNTPLRRADVESRIRSLFERIDANRDGFVTWEEVQAFRNGERAKLRTAAFDRLDSNHDGSISRQEFDATRRGFGRPGGPDGGSHNFGPHRGRGMAGLGMAGLGGFGPEMFERADSDRDGRISLTEAEALPLKMFDRVDANHDGTITPDERKQARDGMRGRWQHRQS